MDTETIMMLAQLMSQAKGGNKNVSSIGNNLTDPVILALAGVLDPYYGMGGGSSGVIYEQFANDPSTPPAVRAVMDYVDQGMNPYQIEAQINALDPAVKTDSGYTDDQLIAMGREMSTERGKTKSSNVFSKAGLRNPNDVYSLEDVPLNASESKIYSKYLDAAKSSERKLGDAEYNVRALQQRIKESGASKDVEIPDWFPKGAAEGTVAQIGKGAKYNTARIGLDENGKGPNLNTARIGLDADGKGPNLNTARIGADENYEGTPVRMGDYGGGKSKNKSKNVSSEDADAMARALWKRANIQNQKRYDEMRAEAVKEGAFNRAAKSGRTPFTDQASALLQFIAGTK